MSSCTGLLGSSAPTFEVRVKAEALPVPIKKSGTYEIADLEQLFTKSPLQGEAEGCSQVTRVQTRNVVEIDRIRVLCSTSARV